MEIKTLDFEDLTFEEQKKVSGGVPHAVALLAAGGTVVGVILVGAAVGYGIYKLVDWITD